MRNMLIGADDDHAAMLSINAPHVEYVAIAMICGEGSLIANCGLGPPSSATNGLSLTICAGA